MGLTRGEFLLAAAGALVLGRAGSAVADPANPGSGLTATQAGGARPSALRFESRPDLRPPRVRVVANGRPELGSDPYVFLGPRGKGPAQGGALIVDAGGDPIWFHPVPHGAWTSNFTVQQFRGAPVLTWWQGRVYPPGYGRGEGVILDSSYRPLARVRAGHGRQADLHEFTLSPQGTALITCHPEVVRADLSGVGGPVDGEVFESVIQELDVRSGKVLFEWRSLEHVSITESYMTLGRPYDYMHVNSIDVTPDGHLLISARHTCALYKIHRRTGRVIWRLGGARSDFAMAPGSRFWWQHDARHASDGTISLFDNGAGPLKSESQSRGLALQVDRGRRRVHVRHGYRHPRPILSHAMGSVQSLPDAGVMVGWGNVPLLSEFTSDGRHRADFWLPWGHASYRGFRLPWSGTPDDRPIAVARTAGGRTILYVSWNGAAGVSGWEVRAGPSPAALSPVGVARRRGFETAVALGRASGYAAATALGAAGQPLETSNTVALR
jgi:hypothetical protein